MADVKFLIVTDVYGAMHKVPMNNKAYYLSRNSSTKQKLYSGFYEMGDEEADKFIEKNKGRDPKFVRPAEMLDQLTLQNKEIEALRKQLEALQNPTEQQVVSQIKAAQSPEEVSQIAGPYEGQTIEKAATAKTKELNKGK